ncbi:MAG: hypothetical protein ACTSQK_07075 [Candidatus Heimdallarchaeota archaeon]
MASDNDENTTELSKFKHFRNVISDGPRKLWIKPETRIIFLLILARLLFIIFTHWGMDFDFYIEISERILNGEMLYIDIDSTHMPLVDLIYLAMYTICPWKWNIIAVRIFLKFPFLLTDIGIAFAVMKIIEFTRKKEFSTNNELTAEQFASIRKAKLIAGYFIAFSLPLIFQTGGGRYDSLMIFCFTMVVYYLQRKNWFGVAFFAALGTSAKYIGIIFLPFVIFWLRKEDFKPFIFGLLLGFLPIYPFLIICPEDFISTILNRGSHIAYGFSLWHAIYIVWNNFSVKNVGSIEATYDISDEPWFVSDLYMLVFIAVYSLIFVFYIIKWWKTMRSESIDQQSLSTITSLVFIPLFIFSLTFKAINIQVLAWFIPYIALHSKLELTLEYTFLTLVNGAGLAIYGAYNPVSFAELILDAAPEGSLFNLILIQPIIYIQENTSETVWVTVIFVSIIWFLVRTLVELSLCSKVLFSNAPKLTPTLNL